MLYKEITAIFSEDLKKGVTLHWQDAEFYITSDGTKIYHSVVSL